MISHDKYISLLSANIQGRATKEELKAVNEFEKSQPKQCPKCACNVWSPFKPKRVIHDVEKCKPK